MGWLQDLIRELAGSGETITSVDVQRAGEELGYEVSIESANQAVRTAQKNGVLERVSDRRVGGGRGRGPGAFEYRRADEE